MAAVPERRKHRKGEVYPLHSSWSSTKLSDRFQGRKGRAITRVRGLSGEGGAGARSSDCTRDRHDLDHIREEGLSGGQRDILELERGVGMPAEDEWAEGRGDEAAKGRRGESRAADSASQIAGNSCARFISISIGVEGLLNASIRSRAWKFSRFNGSTTSYILILGTPFPLVPHIYHRRVLLLLGSVGELPLPAIWLQIKPRPCSCCHRLRRPPSTSSRPPTSPFYRRSAPGLPKSLTVPTARPF